MRTAIMLILSAVTLSSYAMESATVTDLDDPALFLKGALRACHLAYYRSASYGLGPKGETRVPWVKGVHTARMQQAIAYAALHENCVALHADEQHGRDCWERVEDLRREKLYRACENGADLIRFEQADTQ